MRIDAAIFNTCLCSGVNLVLYLSLKLEGKTQNTCSPAVFVRKADIQKTTLNAVTEIK